MKINYCDSIFRVDMADYAIKEIKQHLANVEFVRRTVPGVKDLPVACKKFDEEEGCEMVMALGMPGPEAIDKQCAHEASAGLITAQLMTNTHILECSFMKTRDLAAIKDLKTLAINRVTEHTQNLVKMLSGH